MSLTDSRVLNAARKAAGLEEETDPDDRAEPSQAIEIADKLGYVIDFRHGFVEAPKGDMKRFEPLGPNRYRSWDELSWYDMVYILAART